MANSLDKRRTKACRILATSASVQCGFLVLASIAAGGLFGCRSPGESPGQPPLVQSQRRAPPSSEICCVPEGVTPFAIPNPRCLNCQDDETFLRRNCSAVGEVSANDWRPIADHIELSEPRSIRLACIVYTFHENRDRQIQSYLTWGQYCHHFRLFSDEDWIDAESGAIARDIDQNSNPPHVDKSFAMIRSMTNILKGGEPALYTPEIDWDFVLVCGDDTYVIVPNMISYLATFPNGRENDFFIGRASRISFLDGNGFSEGVPLKRETNVQQI